ncbi:aa3-type cytochrome oxidase subunit IV [Streptomyces sp. NY05-11A]|uniref:aa3-type cytochrome oxidase subunit IV n=1 Tax=Streptomyces soliscabiei TaxID=588897 RepID=UPI0029A61FB4|nr:cytochrome c oxidase subunit 4 [Streptomyces sp. NY05-11A]MDX2682789.1 cytochrome c oxidase subunit 4 [Streptomyces sp. NY05-11A]
MRAESFLFGGVAAFFGGSAVLYGVWSHADPAGTAALIVACLMAAVISFFCATHYRRKGLRPQDRGDAEVADGAGPLEFFPPESPWPVVVAAGFAVTATGVVFGLWLFLIGAGVLGAGVSAMVFQYADRDSGRVD